MPDTLPRELGSILQLKVRLLGVSPMVWRRLLVPSSYTLRELHGVIQVAMGWEATHLYRFFIRAVHYGSIELGVEIPDVTLGSFQFRKNAKFTYDYDMGDLWRHEIRVEGEGEAESGKRYPLCIGGKRACPPEDSGGPDGYAEQTLAARLSAYEDLATMAEIVQRIALDREVGVLDDPETRNDLEQAVDRYADRERYLWQRFSRRAINANLRQDAHHEFKWQQIG
jgi:hypothetical protein